ncbi:MAG: sulfite exporter TauE/SafE family protein [Clostridia bacterium]|nr:sulfite exporter TauE/SafE family protein [Clostridia bacterium]
MKKERKMREKLKEKFIVGLIAGIISGLFSAGGGMILVPAFIHIFGLKDNKARATSVFTILPLVIVSGIFYYKNNFVDWNIGIKCAIGGIVGGIIGAKLLKKISNKTLRILFVIFLIYVSIKMIIG